VSKSVEKRLAACKVIRITCKGADTMPLSAIKELQGQLKSLSTENYEKLKALIIDLGFSFPIEVAIVDGKPLGVIDGHQRLRTIRNMVEKEGWKLPDNRLPVCWKYCKDRKEAGKAILAAVSQFGKVVEDGLYQFTHDFKIGAEELKTDFDLPDFDMEEYLAGFGAGGTGSEIPEDNQDIDEGKLAETENECPKCGFKW
jgi:hypothetical protein